MLFNVHFDIYETVRINFLVDGAGMVRQDLDVTKVEIDHWRTDGQNAYDKRKTKAILCEVLFIFFVMYETVKFWSMVYAEWRFITDNLEEPYKYRPNGSYVSRLAIWLRIQP